MKRVYCAAVVFAVYLGTADEAHSDYLYWSNRSGGEIRRANLDGSGQTILVTGENLPDGPALDVASGQMYWGRASEGSVHRANLDGTGRTVVLTGLASMGAPGLDLAGRRMYLNIGNAG